MLQNFVAAPSPRSTAAASPSAPQRCEEGGKDQEGGSSVAETAGSIRHQGAGLKGVLRGVLGTDLPKCAWNVPRGMFTHSIPCATVTCEPARPKHPTDLPCVGQSNQLQQVSVCFVLSRCKQRRGSAIGNGKVGLCCGACWAQTPHPKSLEHQLCNHLSRSKAVWVQTAWCKHGAQFSNGMALAGGRAGHNHHFDPQRLTLLSWAQVEDIDIRTTSHELCIAHVFLLP
jgi:hypothetical protein